ncbi:MAG: AraC family transcriptional regulator [Sphingomonas sp.]|uniref:AraC family transcriptional regulator n=1 Tax=Sphingomonas sp. TaxID=28214 RepID=UPI001B2AC01B|nr:AraC family transcriptional regulator [Sphingomonas sp.]MBO9622608.1 AraC family transcriptional regulator [Sphingomonas sp.]
MTTEAERRYLARFQRVLDHVDANLDAVLDVDTLAAVATFSPFHFHRQFAELTGVTIHRYVQLARLKRASYALAFRDAPVTEVALASGYGGSEAFARAFRARLGQTPSEFRRSPDWEPWAAAIAPLDRARRLPMTIAFTDADVRILDFPETRVAMLTHRGDPAAIGDTVRRFIAWRHANGLPPARSRTFNLLHDDPATAPPEQFRLTICAGTDRAPGPNEHGVVEGRIPAGRCAVVRLTGSSDDLKPAVHFLYADWLPRSGEELRDFPVFAERVRFFPDVPENEAITDIYLPLR